MNKPPHLTVKLGVALAVAAALSSTHAAAANRCVNPGGTGGCFSTIAGAIAASADNGDSIDVAAGTYIETNIPYDKSVNVTGAGVGATIVDGGGAGQVFSYPNFGFPVTATMSNLTVRNGFRGINVGGGNNVTLDHVRVTANGPGTGAGIFNGATVLHLTNSTVDGNNATNNADIAGCDWGGGSGGGIASLCGGGANFISNSTITGNTASRWGGGIIINDGVSVIENSTISGNHANYPDAGVGGGAMFIGGGFPDITIRYTTIVGNTAVGVGGIWGYTVGDAHVKIFGSILQGNTGTNCRVDSNAAAEMITSLGYNISSDASCLWTQAGDLTSTSAMAGPLQDNGGATATHSLVAASPAVDHIPAASCGIAGDQRGVARPQDAGCDVGAFEWFDVTPPVLAQHADASAEATSAAGAAVSYALPSATDDVAVVSTFCLPVSGSVFALGDTTVGCTATDARGNAGHSSFAVHVVDTTAPSLTLPSGVSVLQSSPAGATATYTATATDLVDGSFAASCAPASGSLFAPGDTTVRCSATDAHGNLSGVGSFTVHVAGVQEQIAALLAFLAHQGPGNSLIAKVSAALAMAASQHPALACGVMGALLNEVRAQSGKKIPVATATQIITDVNQIRAAMGC